jgi:fermentation-respiration switch protein FrsA (DUF1100 family)
VKAVATLASVSSTTTDLPDLEAHLREKGYYPMPNARTKQLMPIGRQAFEDAARHSIEDAARGLACPLLLVHGDADEAVPVGNQEQLRSWQPAAETLTIAGAGHTFGAVHPFAGPTPELTEAIDAAAAFFAKSL